ncbi:hypothetical protein CFOL_v3_26641 [Cephalotus follicularis]|uniref:Uncharacterized protein n=1 Tax=Cephalotus follicularis TaxID=3775 RepID=A0A1Q3CSQ3_CEPFO|nr:hypothetical protein CFOL_v3_26641 [Cephalotus follicularis]
MNKVDTNLPELVEMLWTTEVDMGHGRSMSDVMFLPSTSSRIAPRGSGSRGSTSNDKAPMKPKGKKKNKGRKVAALVGLAIGGSVLDTIGNCGMMTAASIVGSTDIGDHSAVSSKSQS